MADEKGPHEVFADFDQDSRELCQTRHFQGIQDWRSGLVQ